MNIVSLLDVEHVFPRAEARNKKDILNKLIDSLQSRVNDQELEAIRKAVFEREEIMSTGVGKGLAIPHGKARGIEHNYAAFAILDQPVAYEAVDDEPVSMVFLLVGPESSNNLHIKLLSRISRLMNNADFRSRLLGCTTAEDIIDVFQEEENMYFGA